MVALVFAQLEIAKCRSIGMRFEPDAEAIRLPDRHQMDMQAGGQRTGMNRGTSYPRAPPRREQGFWGARVIPGDLKVSTDALTTRPMLVNRLFSQPGVPAGSRRPWRAAPVSIAQAGSW